MSKGIKVNACYWGWFGGDVEKIYARAAHLDKEFERIVADGVAETLKRGLDIAPRSLLGGHLTSRERLKRDIQFDAHTIRSWRNKPSDYGKAVCALLRVERRLRAQVLIRAGRETAVPRNGEVTQSETQAE